MPNAEIIRTELEKLNLYVTVIEDDFLGYISVNLAKASEEWHWGFAEYRKSLKIKVIETSTGFLFTQEKTDLNINFRKSVSNLKNQLKRLSNFANNNIKC